MRFLTVGCSALLGLAAWSGSTEPAGVTAVLIPHPGHGLYANEPGGFYHLLSGVLPCRVLGFPATLGLFTNFGTIVVATDTAITVPATRFTASGTIVTKGSAPRRTP